MNQRERFLAILVGGLLVGLVVWWGINKYRSAIDSRTTQISRLEQQQQEKREQILQGHLADRQMGEYMMRSLPGDVELARSVYQQWLLTIGRDNNISDLKVTPSSAMPVAGLYQRIPFRLTGKGNTPDLIALLHDFYSKDYLHLIDDLSVRGVRNEDQMRIEMSVEAVALLDAPVDGEPPGDTSWRVDPDVTAYIEPIMNRNFYEPPNEAPRYTGNGEIEAIVGRETPTQLTFEDPGDDSIRYELVGQSPEGIELDSESGTLRVRSEEVKEIDLLVRATDSGYPQRTTEQQLTVKVVEPPPPPKDEPKLKFDDATQTVLTGLVHGRDDWTAWMHVRTQGKTLKLRVGDQFEIGSMQGEVVEVTPRFVVLESGGRRFTLKPNGNLKDAADRAAVD